MYRIGFRMYRIGFIWDSKKRDCEIWIIPIWIRSFEILGPGDTVSRLESSWDGPVYTAATFTATVWSHRESLLQTGFKRERDNKRDKTRAGAKTGMGLPSCFLRSLMVQLAWFLEVADLIFKSERKVLISVLSHMWENFPEITLYAGYRLYFRIRFFILFF